MLNKFRGLIPKSELENLESNSDNIGVYNMERKFLTELFSGEGSNNANNKKLDLKYNTYPHLIYLDLAYKIRQLQKNQYEQFL